LPHHGWGLEYVNGTATQGGTPKGTAGRGAFAAAYSRKASLTTSAMKNVFLTVLVDHTWLGQPPKSCHLVEGSLGRQEQCHY